MLKNIKNDLLYLLGILNSISKIKKYSSEYTSADSFYNVNDQLNFNACLNLLINIGENANKLSEELKNKYPKIEWIKIIAYRNRVVHDYKNIDIFVTHKIIKEKLPELESTIYNIVESRLRVEDFDKEEYFIAKQSDFYRLIDFTKIQF